MKPEAFLNTKRKRLTVKEKSRFTTRRLSLYSPFIDSTTRPCLRYIITELTSNRCRRSFATARDSFTDLSAPNLTEFSPTNAQEELIKGRSPLNHPESPLLR